MDDDDEEVRQDAVNALAEISERGDSQIVAMLVGKLEDTCAAVRYGTLSALEVRTFGKGEWGHHGVEKTSKSRAVQWVCLAMWCGGFARRAVRCNGFGPAMPLTRRTIHLSACKI